MDSIDKLTRDLTAFDSLADMLNAEGGYRPTILPRDERHIVLADAYDAAQIRRGDERRAYRGSNWLPRGVPPMSVRLSSTCPHGKPSRECCGNPEWLQVVHQINRDHAAAMDDAQALYIGTPIASYDWWTGDIWAEEYDEFRILLGTDGDNRIVAKTPEAADALRRAVLTVTGRRLGRDHQEVVA